MQKKPAPNMIHSASVFSLDNPYYIHKSVLSETFELHRHDFFEIDIMISGEGISCINGENYKLSEGDIVFLSPSDHHSYIIEENQKLEFMNIAFSLGLLSPQAMSVMSSDTKVVHLTGKDYECVKKLCEFLVEKYDNNPADCALMMKTSIEWLFVFLSFITEQHQKSSNSMSNFSKVLLYINDHFSEEDLNRATVASIMYMSPTHFSKKFHKLVGIPFQDYLLNTRLNYANGMLKMTNMTVSQVAHLSGFGSDSYFSKVFKKRFGVTPGKVRKTEK